MVKAVGIDVSLVELKDELEVVCGSMVPAHLPRLSQKLYHLIEKVDNMLEFIKEETEEYDPEHGACCRNGCMKCER